MNLVFKRAFIVIESLLLLLCGKMALQNVNPVIYDRAKERILTKEEQDDTVTDKIDEREVFGKCFQFIQLQQMRYSQRFHYSKIEE